MSFSDFLSARKPAAWAVIALTLPLIAAMDYYTGTEVSFSVFYLIPISAAAWYLGRAQAIAVSLLAALFWFWIDRIGGHVYSSPDIPYWNSLVRLLFFLVSGISLSKVRTLLRKETDSSRLKSEMVSLVSHEFNNALVNISLVSALLQEGEGPGLTPERQKFYEVLDATQRKLSRTVKTFLTKARLESGKFRLEPRSFELRELVRTTLSSMAPLIAQKGVAVTTDFPPKVVPLTADPDAIGLVIANLIGNAVKYTPSGGSVKIAISVRPAEGRTAEFSVADTGIGISPEEMKAIFSGFHRTLEGQRAAPGFGIGLKVSMELLERHGVRLQAESAPGKGSRFHFSLPVSQDAVQ